jgi:hypothetical protein
VKPIMIEELDIPLEILFLKAKILFANSYLDMK